MLKHEQTNSSTAPPAIPLLVPNAAEARVTPDELNAALKALEDQQSNTVAIGSVVDELRLNATPEEIWEQVQKQRAQKAAEEQARQIPVIASPAAVLQVPPHPRHRRRWAAIGVALIVLGGGIAHSGFVKTPPSVVPVSGSTIVISGEDQTVTITGYERMRKVNAEGKDVVIAGDKDIIRIYGKAKSLKVTGDSNTIIADTAQSALVVGNNNTIQWTGTPPPNMTDPAHRGHFPSTGTP